MSARADPLDPVSSSSSRLTRSQTPREVIPMTRRISRRTLLHIGGGSAATLGFSALGGELTSQRALAQSAPLRSIKGDYKEDLFYREDWLGEPWRKPEPRTCGQ